MQRLVKTLPVRWLAAVSFLFIAKLVLAQTADTAIRGTVIDASGAVVPNASVEITAPATGFTRTVNTNTSGDYELRYLVPGEYEVGVTASGFNAQRRTGVLLQVGQQARIDFNLVVGAVAESVSVSATAALLNTENATLGQVVAPETIANMPLNGRRFIDLAILAPGVTMQSSSSQDIATAAGTRDTTMQMDFDGVTAVANRWAVAHMFPPMDAIQEFRVQTGNYSAEYGGNGGANLNVQFVSGTNKLHGVFYEYLRNNGLDARDYFRPQPLTKNPLHRNQFGTVISGPIRKDKTFLMASFEGVRQYTGNVGTSIVLTPAQRAGNFAGSNITDPLANNTPFPNNTIPSNRLDPVAVAFANRYMPLPNIPGVNNYSYATPSRITGNEGLARLDHRIGSDQITGHFIAQDYPTSAISSALVPSYAYNRSMNVGGQFVHVFTPTFLNEARVGYYRKITWTTGPRSNTDYTPAQDGILTLSKGGPGVPETPGIGFPILSISGYQTISDAGNGPGDASRTFQYVDNVSKFSGNHAFKFGVDVRRLLLDASTTNWPFGQFNYTSNIANNAAASYMLGYPYQILTPESFPTSKTRAWRSFFYAQDDWKVSRKLTLNIGLRYDLMGMPLEVNGVSRTLSWTVPGSYGTPVLWPAPGEVVPLWKNEHWHWAPRLGFAYRLNERTVLRGGYGIFTAANQFDNMDVFQLNPPGAGSITLTNPAVNPIATIENPEPAALFPNPILWNVTTLPPDKYRVNPYIQNWNLTVQREITTHDSVNIAYVASKGTYLDTSITNWNSPQPGPGDIQSRRPWPTWGRIRELRTDGSSNYHALQAQYQHRFNAGLSITASYAWGHMIDTVGDETNGDRAMIQNPLVYERANSLYDIPQRFVASYLYQLPVGKSWKGFLNAAFGGWSISGLVTIQHGPPIWVAQANDLQNDDGTAQNSTYFGSNSTERPNFIPGVPLTVSSPGPNKWFNTAAFFPSVLAYGNTPRNPAGMYAPGISNLDQTLFKSFRMPYRESHQLQFRAEVFNIMNIPHFAAPNSAQGTGGFGTITSTSSTNRLIQFALRYSF
jgi:hypothetical protein